MSVVSCAPFGRARRSGRLTDTFMREYRQPYRVRTDDAEDDPYTIVQEAIAAGSLPALYTSFATDPDAQVKELIVSEPEINNPTVWIVEVYYSTRIADPALQNIDPLDEPAIISFDTERFADAWVLDLNDNPFVNSAGDPFDPPQQVEEGVLIVKYSDNIDSAAGSQILDYLYTANEVSWMGQDPLTCLIQRFSLHRQYRNGVEYWQRQIEFKVDPETDWTVREIIDAGYRKLVNGNPVPAGKNGQTPSRPVLLDGEGGVLDPENIAAGNITLLSFTTRETSDFNTIDPPLQTFTI